MKFSSLAEPICLSQVPAGLEIRVEDLDLEAGTVITRHTDNKGKRAEKVPIHPIVIEHMRPLVGTSKFVFQWNHGEKNLWEEFNRIQRDVGIHLICLEDHEHTPACHTYGFHDLRRAFATLNAEGMKPETLQRMMRHKSYKTTLGYINRSKGVDAAVQSMHVPESLRKKTVSDPMVEKDGDDTADAEPE